MNCSYLLILFGFCIVLTISQPKGKYFDAYIDGDDLYVSISDVTEGTKRFRFDPPPARPGCDEDCKVFVTGLTLDLIYDRVFFLVDNGPKNQTEGREVWFYSILMNMEQNILTFGWRHNILQELCRKV